MTGDGPTTADPAADDAASADRPREAATRPDEDLPTIRESLRASVEPVRRLGVVLGAWLAVAQIVNVLALPLSGAVTGSMSITFPAVGTLLSLVVAVAICRRRPAAVDGLWAFAFALVVAFLPFAAIAVPGFATGGGLYGTPWVVLDLLLAWTAAALVAFLAVYRDGWATLRRRWAAEK